MEFQTVGVIGAGVMGVGVAQNLAQTGHRVVLVDLSQEILERARSQIRHNIRMAGFFQKRTPDSGEALGRIDFTTALEGLGQVDFVIENVVEKWEVKRQVYRAIDPICPPHCVFGVNTSAISITRVGSATRRPSQVIGMHFMNPVPLKPMVEVIRGFHTSDKTLEKARQLLQEMGKDCIVVADTPGFVSNRVLMLAINEAIFLVQDRVAAAEEIDRLFKTCFGHKMGPLETADLIGLDTILHSLEVLQESCGDDKYRPCPLLRRMVDAGLHGRKSGKGFYPYQPEGL